MMKRISRWIRKYNVFLWLIGYIIIALGLIIFLPSSYFPSIYHLPRVITYLLILIAPVLVLIATCLVMLSGYVIMGFAYLIMLIPYGLMALVYGLFGGIMFLIAGIADGIEHLFPKKIDSDLAIIISIGVIGLIIILISISTMLLQLF